MMKGVISGLRSSDFVRTRTCLSLLFAGGLAFSVIAPVQAQDTEEFKPGGKPEVRIFTSFSSTFADGKSHNKFDIGRAYLGYGYNFTRNLYGRIVYDVADPSVGNMKFTGMLKFAYLKYQTDKWTITGGMIPLPEYDYVDKKWAYRYVYKPSHDQYGFGVAADLGFGVAYKIAPWIAADITVTNGEGFKLTEVDSTMKAAAGITLMPVKNVSLRLYYDRMGKDGSHQQTAEVIASYENKGTILSASYHSRINNGLLAGYDLHALSFNGRVAVSEKIRIFGRYDFVASAVVENDEEPWNLNKDGQLFLTGIEILIAPGVSLAPNYQGWLPASSDLPFISRFSLSLDLKI